MDDQDKIVEKNIYSQGTLDEILPGLFPDQVVNKSSYGYRVQTACQIAGISYRQLDYWARTDLVVPSIKTADGSGTHRLYSFKDILVLKVVKRLLGVGISLQNIRLAVHSLRKRGVDDLANITIISDGISVYECTSSNEVIDLLQDGQGVFAIAIDGPMRELSGTISNFPAERIDKGDEMVQSSKVADELAIRRKAKQNLKTG